MAGSAWLPVQPPDQWWQAEAWDPAENGAVAAQEVVVFFQGETGMVGEPDRHWDALRPSEGLANPLVEVRPDGHEWAVLVQSLSSPGSVRSGNKQGFGSKAALRSQASAGRTSGIESSWVGARGASLMDTEDALGQGTAWEWETWNPTLDGE